MNNDKAGWCRRYKAELRKHLDQGHGAGVRSAHGLGLQAVKLGMEPLDLALVHEQALATVVKPVSSDGTRQRIVKQATRFFAEAIVPIEGTHRAALKAGVRVNQLMRALRRRTVESSASIRSLKRNILLREGTEQALRKSGKRQTRLLAELRCLQKRLRKLTNMSLSKQEDERQRMSRQLHDELAQGLIAIDLRLLSLKKAARASTTSFKKEIASTQRLVKESVKRMSRAGNENSVIGIHNET